MGDRFAQLLDVLDDDVKRLLANTRGIIIDSNLIGSGYDGDGMMKISPKLLWLTPEEKQTLTAVSDGNSTSGTTSGDSDSTIESLGFKGEIYLTKNGDNVAPSSTLTTRTIEDVKYSLVFGIYQVMGWTSSRMPQGGLSALDTTLSMYQNNTNNKPTWVSARLYESMPLKSEKLFHLADVYYNDANITEADKSVTSEEVGSLLATEGSVGLFGYAHNGSDMGVLFASTMLKYHYGINTDVVVYDKDGSVTCVDLGWGEYNRLANPLVKPRAEFVAKAIMPSVDWSGFFAVDVGESEEMDTNKDICSLYKTKSQRGGDTTPKKMQGVDILSLDMSDDTRPSGY